MFTKALEILEASSLSEKEKIELQSELSALRQRILQNEVTLENLPQEIATLGEKLNLPRLQALGLELQILQAQNEEKTSLQQQLETITSKNPDLENILGKLYTAFTNKELSENSSLEEIIEQISNSFVNILQDNDQDKLQTLVDGLNKQFGLNLNSQKLLNLISPPPENSQTKRSEWLKTAGGVGILLIIAFILMLFRSVRSDE